MERHIAIAALVRNPAERTAIRHVDRQRPAGFWHARGEQRRSRQYAAEGGEHGKLRVAAEIARIEPQPASANLQTGLRVTLQIHERVSGRISGPVSWPACGLLGLPLSDLYRLSRPLSASDLSIGSCRDL